MPSHDTDPTLLLVDEVSVHFGGVKAVDALTLNVADGELLGLVGPNGSGKSTLLGAISRLTAIHSGELSIHGERVERKSPAATARLGIARTFQTVRLLSRLTVLENVMLGANLVVNETTPRMATWYGGGYKRERELRDIGREALSRVGLDNIAGADTSVLPYGVQRKVEIARALAARPKLLLLDEPTAGMSRNERDEIGDIIVQLASEGLAEILVEHDVTMMVNVCPRLVVMSQGRILADGDARAVVRQENVQQAYLGGDYRDPS
jgi:ABC-type branched-subunit amino acid transport system ATPase component